MEVPYSFGLYVLFILLPIIPAAVLFWLFPDSKLGVKGPLQNLTLNATGAFGGYIVTALLSFAVVQNVMAQINDLSTDKVWTVSVPIELADADGKQIANTGRITGPGTTFDFDQALYQEGGGHLVIDVPIAKDRWRTIFVTKYGFKTASVPLQTLIDDKDRTKIEIDPVKRKIKVLKPITLAKTPETSDAPYAAQQQPLPELPERVALNQN